MGESLKLQGRGTLERKELKLYSRINKMEEEIVRQLKRLNDNVLGTSLALLILVGCGFIAVMLVM